MLPVVYCFYCVLCAATVAVRGANVLVFMPLPIKSHFRGFQPLFEELSRRGHNVTVASSYPLDRPIANYTDIGPFVSEDRGTYVPGIRDDRPGLECSCPPPPIIIIILRR